MNPNQSVPIDQSLQSKSIPAIVKLSRQKSRRIIFKELCAPESFAGVYSIAAVWNIVSAFKMASAVCLNPTTLGWFGVSKVWS